MKTHPAQATQCALSCPLILVAILCSFLARSGAQDFNDSLNFTDNQIPPGWGPTIIYGNPPGRNAGVRNQRFEAGATDTEAILEAQKTVAPGTLSLTANYRLFIPAGTNPTRVEFRLTDGLARSYGCSLGKSAVNPGGFVRVGQNSPSNAGVPRSLPEGVYQVKLTFSITNPEDLQSGLLQAEITPPSGSIFGVTQVVPGFVPANVLRVSLICFVSNGATVWIDDVVLATTVRPVVETLEGATFTASGATLKGLLTTNGRATQFRFRYGLNSNLDSSQLVTPLAQRAAGESGEVSAVIPTGLQANAVYYYRLEATHDTGAQPPGASFVVGQAKNFFTRLNQPPKPTTKHVFMRAGDSNKSVTFKLFKNNGKDPRFDTDPADTNDTLSLPETHDEAIVEEPKRGVVEIIDTAPPRFKYTPDRRGSGNRVPFSNKDSFKYRIKDSSGNDAVGKVVINDVEKLKGLYAGIASNGKSGVAGHGSVQFTLTPGGGMTGSGEFMDQDSVRQRYRFSAQLDEEGSPFLDIEPDGLPGVIFNMILRPKALPADVQGNVERGEDDEIEDLDEEQALGVGGDLVISGVPTEEGIDMDAASPPDDNQRNIEPGINIAVFEEAPKPNEVVGNGFSTADRINGFAMIRVKKSAKRQTAKLAGRLRDSSQLSNGYTLLRDGFSLFDQPTASYLPSGSALIFGFNNDGENAATGSLTQWFRAGNGSQFPAINERPALRYQPYRPPGKNEFIPIGLLDGEGNAEIRFNIEGKPEPMRARLTIPRSGKGKFTVNVSNQIKVTFKPSSGMFSGTVIGLDGSNIDKFSGVLQPGAGGIPGAGRGTVNSNGASSWVTITPVTPL